MAAEGWTASGCWTQQKERGFSAGGCSARGILHQFNLALKLQKRSDEDGREADGREVLQQDDLEPLQQDGLGPQQASF